MQMGKFSLGLVLFCLQPALALAQDAKLTVSHNYVLPKDKVEFMLTVNKEVMGEAVDAIQIKAEGKDVVSVTPGKDIEQTGEPGQKQVRSYEWTVPGEATGQIEITWSYGDISATTKITVCKEAKKMDWSKATAEDMNNAAVLMQTNMGDFLIGFYPEKAPNTVRNFLKLTADEFYDGVIFHRIIRDFMVQGGDPTGTGTGDPGYKIDAEFNDIPHEKGVLSMARSADPNSAGCQFFIVHGQHATHLDGQYTAFGKLIDGYDTLEKCATVKTGRNDRPVEEVKMTKVRVVEKPKKQ